MALSITLALRWAARRLTWPEPNIFKRGDISRLASFSRAFPKVIRFIVMFLTFDIQFHQGK